MSTRGHDDDGPLTPATLGDLLYPPGKDRLVPEKEWVGLIASVAAGDQQGLRNLYERMHRLVFTLAMRITNDPETAEEVTLDVFHAVWQNASSYDAAAGTVVAWVMTQTRSRAIDRIRFERRLKRVNPYADVPLLEQTGCAPGTVVHDERGRICNALSVLKPEERIAIETTFFLDLSYAEAARRLDQPLGTLKTRIRSGLAKLRQVLQAEDQ